MARQPLLHGPGHYDRAAARLRGVTAGQDDGRAGAVPGPPWDPQDVADAPTLDERIAASGVTGDTDAERRAAYAAYLTMLGSGTVQLAVKVAHEYLNKHSLVVSAGPDGPRFRIVRRPHPAREPGGSAADGAGGRRVQAGDHGTAARRRDLGRQLGHLRQLPRPC